MTVFYAYRKGWGFNMCGVFLPACFPMDSRFSGPIDVEGSSDWKGSLNAPHCHS